MYAFVSRPVICNAQFTVTASALPDTGSTPSRGQQAVLPPWAIPGLGAAAVAAGLVLAGLGVRRRNL
ncbi:MAG: hypothetical protein WD379_01875 [Dehalococcoidia bacterium]